MSMWAKSIAKQATELTGRDFDISHITRQQQQANQSRHCNKQKMEKTRSSQTQVPSQQHHRPTNSVIHHLGDLGTTQFTRDWFFVKCPTAFGAEAYHRRFVIVKQFELLLFKHEISANEDNHLCAGVIDLRVIKDVREGDLNNMDTFDFTLKLVEANSTIHTIVAYSQAQKEAWLTMLIWASDYYFDESEIETSIYSNSKQNVSSSSPVKRNGKKVHQHHRESLADGAETTPKLLQRCIALSGWVKIGQKSLFATISQSVFSTFLTPEDVQDAWGDPIHAYSLRDLVDIRSDGVVEGSFRVKIEGEKEFLIVPEEVCCSWGATESNENGGAENIKISSAARKWMLMFCSCGGLVLVQNSLTNASSNPLTNSNNSSDMDLDLPLALEEDVVEKKEGWCSKQPKEGWLWKLDRLYRIFRKRFFSLRNDVLLLFQTSLDTDRQQPMGIIHLPYISHLTMSHIYDGKNSGEGGYYQLFIMIETTRKRTKTDAEEEQKRDGKKSQSSIEDEEQQLIVDPLQVNHYSIAFDKQEEMEAWTMAIYDACTNAASSKRFVPLNPPDPVQTLPGSLLKGVKFDRSPSFQQHLNDELVVDSLGLHARGWFYYRCYYDNLNLTSKSTTGGSSILRNRKNGGVFSTIDEEDEDENESSTKCRNSDKNLSNTVGVDERLERLDRIRYRFFVLWGFEMCIFKHEVLNDEDSAICYGVIDCRDLIEVKLCQINSPENAIELVLTKKRRIMLVPSTDKDALIWRRTLLEAKRIYGTGVENAHNKSEGSSSAGNSSLLLHEIEANEVLIRKQVQDTVVHSGSIQEWDGSKWDLKFFAVTVSRVIVFSQADHLYDEEADILDSFLNRDILEVRASVDELDAIPDDPFGTYIEKQCVFVLIFNSKKKLLLNCETPEICLQWMRVFCSSHGKLVLKKKVASGQWGSTNRIGSISNQTSVLAATSTRRNSVEIESLKNSGKTRQAAARRRTLDLITNRQSARMKNGVK